jgi:hypothetical protein
MTLSGKVRIEKKEKRKKKKEQSTGPVSYTLRK